MLEVILAVTGAAVVAAVGADIAVTLLHPAARGPLGHLASRGAWSLVSALSRSGRSLSFAGPLAMGANMVGWVSGLWLGFALVFAAELGLPDALFRSGEALTTVGYGFEAFEPEWLRYVAAFEAAAGLAAFTAAIAYVLSVYPLVTELRATALYLSDLGVASRDGARAAVELADPEEIRALIRRLIEIHEHVKRFPVLYYFESGDEHESIATLLKGAALTAAVLCEPDAPSRRRAYGRALGAALERLLDDLERDFIGGRTQRRAAIARPRPDGLLERADAVIGRLAREHRQPYEGLVRAEGR